jgi:hypothetical protein
MCSKGIDQIQLVVVSYLCLQIVRYPKMESCYRNGLLDLAVYSSNNVAIKNQCVAQLYIGVIWGCGGR